MDRRALVGFIGAVVLLSSGLSWAANEGRVEPLDGAHSLSTPPSARERLEAHRPVNPDDALRPPARMPFGEPSPPSQLTPAPVLPFNPNGSLMPTPRTTSPPAPPPLSGVGRPSR